jgi:hypothetical protein
MAVLKKTKGITTKQRNSIVVICVFVLILIPCILWFSNLRMQEPGNTSYKGDSYTFYYPTGWSMNKSMMANIPGGTELFLQPPNPFPPKTPNVTIEVASDNPTNMSDMTDAFRVFKYAKSAALVDGVTAQKYTTTVDASEGVLHSTAYVFEVKGKIYLIALGYKQQSVDLQLESEFNQIITSFKAQ